jgi:hypothetical protein
VSRVRRNQTSELCPRPEPTKGTKGLEGVRAGRGDVYPRRVNAFSLVGGPSCGNPPCPEVMFGTCRDVSAERKRPIGKVAVSRTARYTSWRRRISLSNQSSARAIAVSAESGSIVTRNRSPFG